VKTNIHFLCEDQYTFFIISRSFFLRIRNISDKNFGENKNTHFMFSNFFLWILHYCTCALCSGYLRLQTHSEYVILIALPLWQWLHECGTWVFYFKWDSFFMTKLVRFLSLQQLYSGCIIDRREPLHRSFRRHMACGRRPTSSEILQFIEQWRRTPSRLLGPI